MPQPATRTISSPGPGTGSGSVSISNELSVAVNAARTSPPPRRACHGHRAPGFASRPSNRPAGRRARYSSTTPASSAGVAPCMITPSTPRSNWRSTRCAHCAGVPYAAGSSHSSGSSVAMCSSGRRVRDLVDRARHRLRRPRRPGSGRARRGPSRSSGPGGRRSPGGRWRGGRRSSSAGGPRGWCRGSWRSTTTCAPPPDRGRPPRPPSAPSPRRGSVVSSVKNVCSTTMSKARPAERERVRPERDQAERDVLVERRVEVQDAGTCRRDRRGR